MEQELVYQRHLWQGPTSQVRLYSEPAAGRQVVVKSMHVHQPLQREDPGHRRPQLHQVQQRLRHGDDHPMSECRVFQLLEQHGHHDNIVRIHSHEVSDEVVTARMDYYPHQDLTTWLSQENGVVRAVPEAQAARIIRQVIEGVRYLHKLGIAHRDLSLDNVLVAPDQTFKITDFGLSCAADRPAYGRVGQDHCMAPEVQAGGMYDPKKADVWSLGVMLFALLTGSPFMRVANSSDPAFTALQQHGVHGILQVWGVDHSISTSMVDLITQMLAVDPQQRIQLDQLSRQRVILA